MQPPKNPQKPINKKKPSECFSSQQLALLFKHLSANTINILNEQQEIQPQEKFCEDKDWGLAYLNSQNRRDLNFKPLFQEKVDKNPLFDDNFAKKTKYLLGDKQNLLEKDCSLLSSLQCTFKKSNQKVGYKNDSLDKKKYQSRNKSSISPYREIDNPMKKIPSQKRIEQLSQPRKLKTQNSEIQFVNFQKKKVPPQSMTIAQRNDIWLQQRKNKLQKIKKEQQEETKKQQQCTFTPKIKQYKGEKSANLSNFGKKGLVNYFQRVTSKKNLDKYSSNVSESSKNLHKAVSHGVGNELLSKNIKPKLNSKQSYQQAVDQLQKKIMMLKI